MQKILLGHLTTNKSRIISSVENHNEHDHFEKTFHTNIARQKIKKYINTVKNNARSIFEMVGCNVDVVIQQILVI